MSATVVVEVDAGPVERVRADVAVVFFFESDRPLRGGAGRADWRLCGELSRLILSGRIAGSAGEAVLMPTRGGMAAPLLMGLGLGSRNRFDAEACAALGREAVARATRLSARTLVLPLPDPHAGDLDLGDRLDALLAGAVEALADLSADVRLRLVVPPAEVARARQVLAGLAPRRTSASVALRVAAEPAPGSARAPQGALRSSAERPQLVK